MDKTASPFGPPEKISDKLVFRPASAPSRGLIYAYACVLMAAIAAWFLWSQQGGIPIVLSILACMFMLAGMLITFSRWMDTGTWYKVSEHAIEYHNPLRITRIEWGAVQEMRALQTGSIFRVLVVGPSDRFQFRISLEPTAASGSSFPLGLPEGDQLARLVRGMSGVNQAQQASDGTWFYSRMEEL